MMVNTVEFRLVKHRWRTRTLYGLFAVETIWTALEKKTNFILEFFLFRIEFMLIFKHLQGGPY